LDCEPVDVRELREPCRTRASPVERGPREDFCADILFLLLQTTSASLPEAGIHPPQSGRRREQLEQRLLGVAAVFGLIPDPLAPAV